ncbi:MAG: SDR family oxidoreductase, partial [Planctomycetota bacterium]
AQLLRRPFENPAEDFSRTVAAAGHLFEWIRLTCPDVPVVVVSSAAVYGAGHDGRIEEESELRPYSPYGSHKAMLESLAKSYCKNFCLKIAICRLFSVYGEGLEKQLIYDLCCKAENAEQNEDRTLELGGTGDELRDWVHVDDVCRLLETVMRQCDPSCPTFNGGRGQAISVREVAQSFSRAWGSDFQVQFNGRGRSGDPLSLVACPKRIQSLPFEFSIDLDRGLKRVVDYHRQQEAVG